MIPESNAWCTSCQRWLRCRCGFYVAEEYTGTVKAKTCACFVHTCYDQRPKLYVGDVGAGKKWHLGYPTKLYALCGSGEFKALVLKTKEDTSGVCKNCVREWRKQAEYRDF